MTMPIVVKKGSESSSHPRTDASPVLRCRATRPGFFALPVLTALGLLRVQKRSQQ